MNQKLFKELEKVLASRSKQSIISFLEANNEQILVNLLNQYVAEKANLKKLKKDKKFAKNFLYLVSTLLLKLQTQISSPEPQKRFSINFYDSIKILLRNFSETSYGAFS